MTERNGNGHERHDTDPSELLGEDADDRLLEAIAKKGEEFREVVRLIRELRTDVRSLKGVILSAVVPRVGRLDHEHEGLVSQVLILSGLVGAPSDPAKGTAGTGLLGVVEDLKKTATELKHDRAAELELIERRFTGLDQSLWAAALAFDRLAKTVGEAPDATGKGGTGLSGAVSTLMAAFRNRANRTGMVAATGATGALAVIEIMKEVLKGIWG